MTSLPQPNINTELISNMSTDDQDFWSLEDDDDQSDSSSLSFLTAAPPREDTKSAEDSRWESGSITPRQTYTTYADEELPRCRLRERHGHHWGFADFVPVSWHRLRSSIKSINWQPLRSTVKSIFSPIGLFLCDSLCFPLGALFLSFFFVH
ncbi:hypothetical protein F5X96DRAFT_631554, partial [Biscogniauxia mediterranea]